MTDTQPPAPNGDALPPNDDAVRRRRTNFRIVVGIAILLLLAWCYRIGGRVVSLVSTGSALAHGASRLERVDTLVPPGSRVDFGGATIAELRSTGHLGPATAHPDIDTTALNHRWKDLFAFVEHDSARFAAAEPHGRGGPTPGLNAAQAFLISPDPGDLYLAAFVPGADTARLAHDTTLFAVVDSAAGPIVLHLRAGVHSPGPPRGELLIGPPIALYRVY